MVTRRSLLSFALVSAAQLRTAAAQSSLKSSASDSSELTGKIFLRGDTEYEPLRQAATWNARKPNRFPTAIVLPENERDVIAAVKMAKSRGWQVTTRSGGHSFTGSHTRDNAVQINLARMKELSVDAEARVASVSPGWKCGPFNNVLREKHGLMFPVAHGFDVGLGGFVLCGGHGWNSAVLGLGCENLRGLDVVTADGELIHADEKQNSEFLWAARGAGPGFFGVAVRYYLDIHPQPTYVRLNQYVFPLDVADDAAAWVDSTRFPAFMEPVVAYVIGKDGKPVFAVIVVSFASSQDEANAASAIMSACPIANKAMVKTVDAPAIIPAKSEAEDAFIVPTGGRFTVDGAYSNASLAKMVSLLREEMASPPTPYCNFAIGRWKPIGKVKDMAYSISGQHYFSAMGVSYDPADDERCAAWLERMIKKMTPIATGAQMNDENMPVNKLPYLSQEVSARLEALRAKYDPDRRFASFLK